MFAGAEFLINQIFSFYFCSVPSFGIDSFVNLEWLRMSTFVCGMTEIIPSLFRRIFLEQNFFANPAAKAGQKSIVPA
jgi:hypothetical protein